MVRPYHLLSIAVHLAPNLPMVEGTPFHYRQAPTIEFPRLARHLAAVNMPQPIHPHDDASRFRKALDMAKKLITGRDHAVDISIDSIREILDKIKNIEAEIATWLPIGSTDTPSVSTTSSAFSPLSSSFQDQLVSKPQAEAGGNLSEQSGGQSGGQLGQTTPSLSSNEQPVQPDGTPQPSPTALVASGTQTGAAFMESSLEKTPWWFPQSPAASPTPAPEASSAEESQKTTGEETAPEDSSKDLLAKLNKTTSYGYSTFKNPKVPIIVPDRNSSTALAPYLNNQTKGYINRYKGYKEDMISLPGSNETFIVKGNKTAPNNSTPSPVRGQNPATLATPGPQTKVTPTPASTPMSTQKPQISLPKFLSNATLLFSPSRWNLSSETSTRVSPIFFEDRLSTTKVVRTRTKKATVTVTRTVTEFLPFPANSTPSPTDVGHEQEFINGTWSGAMIRLTAEALVIAPSRAASCASEPCTTHSASEKVAETAAVATAAVALEIPSLVPNYHVRLPWPERTASEKPPLSGFRTLSKPTATVGEHDDAA